MSRRERRFVFVDDVPTPYRVDMFRIFAERFDGAFRILYCAAGEHGRSWDLDFGDLDVTVLPGRAIRGPGLGAAFSLKWNPTVAAELRRFRPSVGAISGYVHPTVHMAAKFFRRHRIPYGMDCESSFLQQRPGGMRWAIKRSVLGRVARGMAFGLPCGELARDYLAALIGAPRPMYLVPNAPDTQPIDALADAHCEGPDRRELLRRFGIDPDRRLLLFVGRLEAAKRPLDALSAFAALDPSWRRRATLQFVGDGSLRPDLERARRELDDPSAVVLSGWLDPQDVYRLMAAANLLVLPSEREAWGAVVSEAFAAGTPVLASDQVAAAHDLVEEGRTGWVVSVGDRVALADRIRTLLEDPQAAAAMREPCRAMARQRDARFAAANLLAAVDEASQC